MGNKTTVGHDNKIRFRATRNPNGDTQLLAGVLGQLPPPYSVAELAV